MAERSLKIRESLDSLNTGELVNLSRIIEGGNEKVSDVAYVGEILLLNPSQVFGNVADYFVKSFSLDLEGRKTFFGYATMPTFLFSADLNRGMIKGILDRRTIGPEDGRVYGLVQKAFNIGKKNLAARNAREPESD